ncbi:M15 family metallopeptidase [Arcicella rosea]|uniref:D-alanyl-D-alanine dipeptidase n=1 Tax=Arcicella rosea TaxID=502909 RepID=A0A841ELZ1_9BACT|nr:M15 family metallopeptidase [Arcicella rosea]MBB6005157.1 D-alanyl-D-alanine dipeptidase [Arcicella rosea]
MRKHIFSLLLFSLISSSFEAKHKSVENEENKKSAKSQMASTCEYEKKMLQQGLVNVREIDASILVELKYSTTDNFVGKDVYGCITNCFMQKRPAEMLKKANTLLQKKHPNYRLLVYDGGRPLSIQKVLWSTLSQYPPRERAKYVANPAQGSIHNYGSAVDLTIATADGKALDMGTKYDYFGELAYPVKEDYFLAKKKLTKQQVANRILLRNVMEAVGFMHIDYEWWHFNAVSRREAKQIYQIIE